MNIQDAHELLEIGRNYAKEKSYLRALSRLEAALRDYRKNLGDFDIRVADCLLEMGKIHWEQKEYEKAKKCFQEADEVCAKTVLLGSKRRSEVTEYATRLEREMSNEWW